MASAQPTVVKIGGSTLGAEDTTLEDIVALQRAGERVIVVHGGGAMITDWLTRLEVPTAFVEGLRSTPAEALDVVVAVLRGVVNAQLVADLGALGGRAVGLCGIDGQTVLGERYDPRLEYVGRVTEVQPSLLLSLLDDGIVPVVAPIGLEPPSQPLNINADTVAGEIARAVEAKHLVFLTDVDGLMDAEGDVLPDLGPEHARMLREAGTLTGGMLPKVDACFRAAESGAMAYIANGRQPGTLHRIVSGAQLGTRIGS